MSEQQSETTITVSGYGRKLCVLAEYMMRSATVGYYAYGQGVMDAAISAADTVQTVAVRTNSRYWRDETLMSGLTNLIRNQVQAAFDAALRAEAESRPKARETLILVLQRVEEQARGGQVVRRVGTARARADRRRTRGYQAVLRERV